MIDQNTSTEIFDAIAKRRGERRNFMKVAGGATAAFGGATLLSACGADNNNPNATPTATASPSPTSTASAATLDLDILNFALNLEYLEAQFYVYAVTGQGLATSQTTGPNSAAPGTVTGGAQANLSGDPLVLAYAREIAADETAHVTFLRAAIGSSAVAMPNINIGGGTNGAFTQAAIAAGIITQGQTFDPYASPENFLLGAFIFEDVGVSAYKGAAPLITNKTYLEAAAGILAVEAYHASIVRTVLYRKGIGTPAFGTTPAIAAQPALLTSADKISDARDSLDGTTDLDQGISTRTTGTGEQSNIVPVDSTGLTYSRSAAQVLNIVYLNKAAVTMGGFFPAGVNGSIKTSANNA